MLTHRVEVTPQFAVTYARTNVAPAGYYQVTVTERGRYGGWHQVGTRYEFAGDDEGQAKAWAHFRATVEHIRAKVAEAENTPA